MSALNGPGATDGAGTGAPRSTITGIPASLLRASILASLLRASIPASLLRASIPRAAQTSGVGSHGSARRLKRVGRLGMVAFRVGKTRNGSNFRVKHRAVRLGD